MSGLYSGVYKPGKYNHDGCLYEVTNYGSVIRLSGMTTVLPYFDAVAIVIRELSTTRWIERIE